MTIFYYCPWNRCFIVRIPEIGLFNLARSRCKIYTAFLAEVLLIWTRSHSCKTFFLNLTRILSTCEIKWYYGSWLTMLAHKCLCNIALMSWITAVNEISKIVSLFLLDTYHLFLLKKETYHLYCLLGILFSFDDNINGKSNDFWLLYFCRYCANLLVPILFSQWPPIVLPDNYYIEHASPEEQIALAGLTGHHIVATALSLLGCTRDAL